MTKSIKLNDFEWINKSDNFTIVGSDLTIQPKSETDLWRRTYYGFRNDNAPIFVTKIEGDFTFTIKAAFDYKNQYDQCGIVLYENSENWVKASVEQENEIFSRLGSVVTNHDFSDWATTNIPAGVCEKWYHISRRQQDYYIEYSTDGNMFKQMRMLHFLGTKARVGVYASSTVKAGFKAIFSKFNFESCKCKSHN